MEMAVWRISFFFNKCFSYFLHLHWEIKRLYKLRLLRIYFIYFNIYQIRSIFSYVILRSSLIKSNFEWKKKCWHNIVHYFGPRRGVLPPVLAFLLADSFLIASDLRLLLVGVDGKTLKKLSNRPCVDVVRVFRIFLQPARIRSSLNCRSPHKNFTKPSSSGSVHLS